MNFCTTCGAPTMGEARFCGNCGTALAASVSGAAGQEIAQETALSETPQPAQDVEAVQQGAAQPPPAQQQAAHVPAGQPTMPAGQPSVWTPDVSAPQAAPATPSGPDRDASAATGGAPDLGEVFRSNPGTALRAAAAVVLVVIALIKPWELSPLGLWGATEGTAAASNGWALVALLLVGVAAAIGFFADNVRTLGLPIEPRVLQALLVAPFGVTALVAMVRMLTEDAVMGPSVALGLVAAILAVQIGAPVAEASTARITAMVLLAFGAVLTLWQLRGIIDLGRIDEMLAVLMFFSVGWIPLLVIWFILGLRDHKSAEWAALIVFGAAVLTAMLLLSEGADVGLTLMLAGATVAAGPGMATLMEMSPDPADRWLQWAAGVMVLWMVGGAVMSVLSFFGAISLAGSGIGVGALVWLSVWGAATAIVAGVARNKLVEEPATGRKIAVILAAASVLIYVISLAALEADLTDPATLLAGLTVPVIVVLMLLVPRSVNRRYGTLLSTGASGPIVD